MGGKRENREEYARNIGFFLNFQPFRDFSLMLCTSQHPRSREAPRSFLFRGDLLRNDLYIVHFCTIFRNSDLRSEKLRAAPRWPSSRAMYFIVVSPCFDCEIKRFSALRGGAYRRRRTLHSQFRTGLNPLEKGLQGFNLTSNIIAIPFFPSLPPS